MIDRVTRWFLIATGLAGLIYVCCGWTPSSYGLVLQHLSVPHSGPVAGSSREVRLDEYGVSTPFLQAAVRNRFRRINETSFYREDMRNFFALPLADWSLIFKPQLAAFFLLPPATALSIYYAVLMLAFLWGYHLLFKQLGATAWLAAGSSVIVFFSGFSQFWWTTYGPLLAGLPWVVLILLSPTSWWKKALLYSWALPVFVLSLVYPSLILALGWGALILILAVRPSVFRSPGNVAAIAIGGLAAGLVLYAYYGDLIHIMRNTVYPGRRTSPAGGTSIPVVLSEFLPYLTFSLSDYKNFTGANICEIGTLGSYLPLLTLCLTRYRELWNHQRVRQSLLVLGMGFIAITLWETAPVPNWIGSILLWNTGHSHRWLFTSGFLLTVASLLIWSHQLISVRPWRLTLFLLMGPVASLLLKVAGLSYTGTAWDEIPAKCLADIGLCGLTLTVGIVAWFVADAARLPVLVIAMAVVNIYAFGRFNPLQPAKPIFEVPDSELYRKLAKAEPSDVVPGESWFQAAELNGLGLRSITHVLVAPHLAFFRPYFPLMDEQKFNFVFNRYAIVTASDEPPLPWPKYADGIAVPREVFVPVRNLRRATFGTASSGDCSGHGEGAIGFTSSPDKTLDIEGWAPWSSETAAQGIRILSARPLRDGVLLTKVRPDVAEQLQDYHFVKSGFHLKVSSADDKVLQPSELVLVAFGTTHGQVRLGCPSP